MWFCPLDGTLLQIQIVSGGAATGGTSSGTAASGGGQSIFVCSTCPYSCNVASNFSKHMRLNRKVVDDILGGAAAWENVDRTMAVCPACSHNEAYFLQMQIRSADEPMSVFYKCVKCSHQWNDK